MEPDENALPRLSYHLIDKLDERYPLRNPKPEATLAEIQREAGRRDVVEHLLALRALEQDENE